MSQATHNEVTSTCDSCGDPTSPLSEYNTHMICRTCRIGQEEKQIRCEECGDTVGRMHRSFGFYVCDDCYREELKVQAAKDADRGDDDHDEDPNALYNEQIASYRDFMRAESY